jgi:hypothetical protein
VIHGILDNHAAHKTPRFSPGSPATRAASSNPTSGSLLNAVETFFSALARRGSSVVSDQSSSCRRRSSATSPSTTVTPSP